MRTSFIAVALATVLIATPACANGSFTLSAVYNTGRERTRLAEIPSPPAEHASAPETTLAEGEIAQVRDDAQAIQTNLDDAKAKRDRFVKARTKFVGGDLTELDTEIATLNQQIALLEQQVNSRARATAASKPTAPDLATASPPVSSTPAPPKLSPSVLHAPHGPIPMPKVRKAGSSGPWRPGADCGPSRETGAECVAVTDNSAGATPRRVGAMVGGRAARLGGTGCCG